MIQFRCFLAPLQSGKRKTPFHRYVVQAPSYLEAREQAVDRALQLLPAWVREDRARKALSLHILEASS